MLNIVTRCWIRSLSKLNKCECMMPTLVSWFFFFLFAMPWLCLLIYWACCSIQFVGWHFLGKIIVSLHRFMRLSHCSHWSRSSCWSWFPLISIVMEISLQCNYAWLRVGSKLSPLFVVNLNERIGSIWGDDDETTHWGWFNFLVALLLANLVRLCLPRLILMKL